MGTGHVRSGFTCSYLQDRRVSTPETNPLPKNAEFPHIHEWRWVPSLKEDALQKHKTARHSGHYRAGLRSQDASLGLGRGGNGEPRGSEPGLTL